MALPSSFHLEGSGPDLILTWKRIAPHSNPQPSYNLERHCTPTAGAVQSEFLPPGTRSPCHLQIVGDADSTAQRSQED